MYKEDILIYLQDYFSENFSEERVFIVDTPKGYKVNINQEDIVYIEEDSDLGWHCYGQVYDEDLANKIEFDFETSFNIINEKYYFNEKEI